MKALFTIAATVAAAVLASPVLAENPADAHQRQQTLITASRDSHDRIGSTVTQTSETVVVDAHDRGSLPLSTPVALAVPVGFDWGDAMIGAGGGVGIALILGGFAYLLVGQRSGARAAIR